MRRMDFREPDFYRGINVTVRRGAKWSERLSPGDKIVLYRTGDPEDSNDYEVGEVLGFMLIPFLFIPDSILTYEHDSRCDNLLGLSLAMSEAYPDFHTGEIVTVIIFKV